MSMLVWFGSCSVAAEAHVQPLGEGLTWLDVAALLQMSWFFVFTVNRFYVVWLLFDAEQHVRTLIRNKKHVSNQNCPACALGARTLCNYALARCEQ